MSLSSHQRSGHDEWRSIFGGLYSVSSEGSVRRESSGRILKAGLDRYGYPKVTLHSPEKKRTVCVHTLVAEAFLGPRPDGMSVNHISGVKTENALRNLEYVTLRENELHAVKNGLKARGERHPSSKLTAELVKDLRAKHAGGESTRAIALRLGVCQASVSAAITGRTWGHIGL